MIVLENKLLENKLLYLSKKLNIQASKLLENFVNDRLNQEKNMDNFSHIEYVSNKENEDILNSLKLISKEDKEIDYEETKIIHI